MIFMTEKIGICIARDTNSSNITKLNTDLSNFKDDVNNLIKVENDYNEW